MNRRKKVNQILKKRAKKQTISQLPKQKSGYIAKADRVPSAEQGDASDSNTLHTGTRDESTNV